MVKVLVVLAVLAGGTLWISGWPGSEEAQAGARVVVLDPASVRAPDGDAQSRRGPDRADSAPAGERLVGKPQVPGGPNARGQQPAGTRKPAPEGSQPARAAAKLSSPDARLEEPVVEARDASDKPDEDLTLKATHPAAPTLAERAARLEALLARASGLEQAGDVDGAASVLRQGMADSTSPVEVARLGFFLAALSDSPAESRRLMTNALRRGVVRDDEYELASDMLRELNRSTGSSLLGLLRIEDYEVQPNDSLWELCNRTFPKKFGVSPEVGLIQLVNGMSGTALRVGQRLAVPQEAVTVEVDRKNHGIVAFIGDVALVAYRVGLGKDGRTPSGTFVIEVKLTEPTWYRDGRAIPYGNPENILGTRWMGFENNPGAMGYGIHGTAHPESVGGDESMGCVRMRNEEVEELFELLPRGTQVSIP